MDPYEESKKNTKRYHKLKKLLELTYGYTEFRPHQYQIINRIICGEDVCGILPTGYGKSLLFQIAGLYLAKLTIVISPLIALMDDQRYNLEQIGVTSCCYNSNADKNMLKKQMMKGMYQFLYTTPESLTGMKEFLIKINETRGIALIAIDECHCISSFGADFRTSYRELTVLKEWMPKIPILAITATATPIVSQDICNVLNLNTKTPITSSFDRPNLYMEIRPKSKKSKLVQDPALFDVLPIIKKHEGKPIIIYCLTIKQTNNIYIGLKLHRIKCGRYHSKLDPDERSKTHKDFLKNKVNVVVATIAFGLGLNKPDVKCVIHIGCPGNVEGYYQEIGRAGRNGKKSYCYLFHEPKDFIIQEMFINSIKNRDYKEYQLQLLKKMHNFIDTKKCRRKTLLEYFNEEYPKDNCGFCDNCCGKDKTVENKTDSLKTKQRVDYEAKLLIDLIESSTRNYGLNMFIDVLRGSKSKKIPEALMSGKFYGKGKDKSLDWWKELGENLITLGYLQSVSVGGRFLIKIIKVTRQGITWSNASVLGDLLKGLNNLEPIFMHSSN